MSDYSSDSEDEHTCVICATVIDLDEDDWHDCDKCNMTCCTDCYVYKPDIFGMKTMEDENGDCWRNCEVCTDCDEEFEIADDKEKDENIQEMKLKHNEPDSEDEDSEDEDSDEEYEPDTDEESEDYDTDTDED